MSTRSRVGYTYEDSTISSIYVHFDGYYEGVGQMLLEHYNSAEQAAELVSLGDASTIYETLEKCVFYGRDRGETGVETKVSENLLAFRGVCGDTDAEYAYLWFDGGWKTGLKRMVPLKNKFKKAS